MNRSQAGQASVEWTGLALLVALLIMAGAYAITNGDGWRFGDRLLHALTCAIGGGCDEGDSLDAAYGDELAAFVRRYTPSITYERDSAALPIDFRRCRETRCSDGSDAAREISRSAIGLPVTGFTRVVDRREAGGALYLQYWFYYPESFSGGIGRALGNGWPGFHPDDWEGYQVRVSPDGRVSARATSHGGYGSGWNDHTGWVRVSGGSHAGEVSGPRTGERFVPASKLSLIPLERLTDTSHYSFEVSPPWRKDVYRVPEASSS